MPWSLRLECCGHPAWEKNNRVSLGLCRRKRADAEAAGARLLVTACTYCQLQFDGISKEHLPSAEGRGDLPAVLVTQLLGRAMGLAEDALGLEQNRIPPKALLT